MQANSWPEEDSYGELDPINSLLSDLSAEDELVVETNTVSLLSSRFQGRRRKAALVLTIVWTGTIALHLVSWGFVFVLGLTTVLGIHALRLVFAKNRHYSPETQSPCPSVSILVAAKNEEAVIGRLVQNLCDLDYPQGKYEVWIVDDNSTDNTPHLLAELAQKYQQLKIFSRPPQSSGGKSGALNQLLPMTQGEIIAVFDADAQVLPDLLLQVIPLFQKENVGAVQLRKAIANAQQNFWTKGQMAEMALDMWFQEQRTIIGGIGELRGNGQFVRRLALENCGGWNEETITDDLDLTIRLHLEKWDITCVFQPPVEEEGVVNATSLWHQRNRWAEGGYQRYLDYWDLILKNRMGTRKTWDLIIFLLTMYILPTAAVPDLFMSILRHRPPVLTSVTSLSLTMSFVGMYAGLKRVRQSQQGFTFSTYLLLLLQTIRGSLYMLHWVIVMTSTTARMSFRPKRLKWVKTIHNGEGTGQRVSF